MPLQPGTKFGSYEVLSLLGVGGMGEVYRARDTLLKRDVAIKALPDAFSRDAERVSRFQREAEVLASLSHPNIAAIHHLEEVDGLRFLVLEFVEGETLEERISRGPAPVNEALRIARQIAEAMEAAHAKGIVHRDLKPANVKITADTKVKVLDFGLAKIYEEELPASNFSQSPTLVSGTMAGALLGTAAYMSPEQARGQNVDHQADIWAFGCILYEMLTGKVSFQGDTMADIFGSILKSEPDWNALPKDTPAAVVRLLRRCLQKERTRRMRDIGDAGLEIDEALTDPLPPSTGTVIAAPGTRAAYAWIVAALAIVTAIASIVTSRTGVEPENKTVRFSVPPPQRFFLRGQAAQFVLSPDGRNLAFVAEDTIRRIWVRSLDATEAKPLAGTDNATLPFWSPDSRYVGFWRNQKLHKISIADGHTQSIANVSGFPSATWSRNNVIVFGDDERLFRVSADGGEPELFVKPEASRKETWVGGAHFLPDGDHLSFSVASEQREAAGLWVISVASGERKRILPFGVRAKYSPATRQLLFVRDGKLIAQPFDAARLEITGDEAVVDTQAAAGEQIGAFDVSSDGVFAWSARPIGAARLVWRDRTGNRMNVGLEPGLYRQVRLSPDGARAAVNMSTSSLAQDIWLLEMGSGVFSRMTAAAGNENDMVWSPDGRELAFAWRGNLYRKTIGASEFTPILESAASTWLHDWSPDGRLLVFARDRGVYIMPASGQGQPSTLLENDFNKDEFRVSPDSRWIAYNSDETGRSEIYAASFPNFDKRRQVSNSGGAIPRWRNDMREMYYMQLDGSLMAVDIRAGEGLETSAPRVLFKTEGPVSSVLDQYDVTADGKTFLLIENEDNAVSPPINLIISRAVAPSR